MSATESHFIAAFLFGCVLLITAPSLWERWSK